MSGGGWLGLLRPGHIPVQENIPGLSHLQAALLHIIVGSDLGSDGLQFSLHDTGGDQCHNKADQERNN